MDRDTHIGGSQDRFPLTQRSMIDAIRGDDPLARGCAVQTMVAAYWKPIYKYIRMMWQASNEEAKDLTQGFFVALMEKGFIEKYAIQRASFRTYLRLCVDGYVTNERKAARRQKRGGDHRLVSLDFNAADAEFSQLRQSENNAEAYFDRECLRSLFEMATSLLRASCEASGKGMHLLLFERYDLHNGDAGGRPTYEQLAAEFNLPVTQVTNHLAWARRTFRRCTLDALRELIGNDEEFREESQRLFGVNT
ncbi:MAG: sigma-70 family RNA polymerase sigma factor [Planctomycetes bacterium]|nr:sigma-70 family RNA polymerase sigma factor [Planctomycetota bacterium]MBI3833115.1 sigma-70 family RNA polymerase sigma factor [Planctomycetota bacterium]